MAIEVTPLDLWAPDGNERVKDGDNAIAHNARTTQALIADLQSRFPSHFDGGSPDTVYAADQIIDGGTT